MGAISETALVRKSRFVFNVWESPFIKIICDLRRRLFSESAHGWISLARHLVEGRHDGGALLGVGEPEGVA